MAHLTRFSYSRYDQKPCLQAIENKFFTANIDSVPQKTH
jgi:hypothetical protein